MKTQILKSIPLFIIFTFFCISGTYTQCYEIYALSSKGEFGAGVIYGTDSNDTLTAVTSLSFIDGYSPHGHLCKASNGKLYGMTSAGGKYDYGVLFEWDPLSGLYIKKIDFDGATNGSYPYGSLIQAGNGKLYGMTARGGTYSCGVLFEWDPLSGMYTKKIDFDGEPNGSKPYGSLVQTDNGLMYGMTSTGGANNTGVLFEWNPVNNNYIKKLDFSGTDNGSGPHGSLIVANNGKLYGMTYKGGLNGLGVLFEWDPSSDTFWKRIDFNDSVSGSHPEGSLLQADNGKLYGMTPYGGQYDFGIIFEWDPENNDFTRKLDFDGVEKGGYPQGSLIKLENGKLAGITASGLFEWDPSSNSYLKKYDLDNDDGRAPSGSLIQADNGKLYGMTLEGGNFWFWYSFGVLFEWDPSLDSFSVKLRFNTGENGVTPVNMVEADNGKFYGTTNEGGKKNMGVIFEFDPSTNIYTKKFDFMGGEDGLFPSGLIKGNNGELYGITVGAGVESGFSWTIFEWDPSENHFTQQFYYDESDDKTQKGRTPNVRLIQADNDKIYGTTREGGEKNEGILFEWDPATATFVKKIDFDNDIHGKYPILIDKARNGKIYGTAQNGSGFDGGFLFEWDPATNSFIKKLDFTDSIYVNSLFQAQNDKFYGAANLESRIILYEWDAETNAYMVKLEFDNYDEFVTASGNNLTPGENGKLYGTIQDETDYYVFEWDPLNDNFQKKFEINSINGEKIHSLVLTRKNITGTHNAFACGEYSSPSGNYIWTESGSYTDTIPSINGCDSVITVILTIASADVSVTLNQETLTANAAGATYQWLDCDISNTPIEGETHQTFVASSDGNYAVIVSQNGCIDTSACLTVNVNSLIANVFKRNITIYPNPNDGLFSIDLGSVYPTIEITITEMDGRILQKERRFDSRNVDMTMVASQGMYMVIITAENERAVFKILKK